MSFTRKATDQWEQVYHFTCLVCGNTITQAGNSLLSFSLFSTKVTNHFKWYPHTNLEVLE